MKFYKLKVIDIIQDTQDAVRIIFDADAQKDKFNFIQGQYLTLKCNIENQEIRRSYSLCKSPYEQEANLEILVKKVEKGLMSGYLNERLKKDTFIDVQTPAGNFYTELSETAEKHYVFFAAGSGITPIYSILHSVLIKEPLSRVSLYYGNRNRQSILLEKQIERLAAQYASRFRYSYYFSQDSQVEPSQIGKLDKEKISHIYDNYLSNQKNVVFFCCGPNSMNEDIAALLDSKGIAKTNIHFECFSAKSDNEVQELTAPDKIVAITVIFDDEEYNFNINGRKQNLLDASIEEGIDAPFACKGGVCCTCKAELLEGKVTMKKNYALDEDELEKNMILTCQSHPMTDKVTISFDL